MAWQFVYRNTCIFHQGMESIKLPIPFKPSQRLLIGGKLLAGKPSFNQSMGTLTQLVFIPGFGECVGDSSPLLSQIQLINPSTEFNFRLRLQPFLKSYSLELSIWKEV